MSVIKVALIEDDRAIVQMYLMRFKLIGGFDVKVANDGESGLILIKAFDPDIVLLDMMMPKMSGLEALTKLRKLPGGKHYKVIALTNMKDEDTLAKVKSLGVEDYVIKAELSPGQLIDHMHKVLGLMPSLKN